MYNPTDACYLMKKKKNDIVHTVRFAYIYKFQIH